MYSKSNKGLVTAAGNGKLAVLNKTLHILKTFNGTENGVLTLAGNDKFIAFSDNGGAVRYYNRDGGMTPKVSKIYNYEYYLQVYYHEHTIVNSIDIENELLASGSNDKKVKIWNMKQNVQLIEVAHEFQVSCVKLVEKSLVSCGESTTIRIWNITSNEQLHMIQLSGFCTNFDMNSERTLLAVAQSNGVSIWSFSNLTMIMQLELEVVADVRFDQTGTQLIIGQYDGQVWKMDLH